MLKTVNAMFEKQVQETPENIALIFNGKPVTYSELNAMANKLAHYFVSEGVGPETLVGMVVKHSPAMFACILAIHKAGGGYIPAEPSFPQERIRFIMNEAKVKLVFTEREFANIFDSSTKLAFTDMDLEKYPSTNLTPTNNAENLAYILFTSGTTGVPKGVMVEQGNVCHYVQAFTDYFELSSNDKMLQYSVCTFDIFTEEVFPILLCGGTLVIANEDETANVDCLVKLLHEQSVTILSGFPYLLQELNSKTLPSSLRIAISGGDVLRKEFVTNIVPKVPVYNTYGPTETTVCASYYCYTGEDHPTHSVPIGKPIKGVEILILDENLNKVAPGEVGEICIVGDGVSRGYLNNENHTKELFVTNPYNPNQRMYLSGDLGKLLENGNIHFLKRKDDQVMIVGKRVEPLEVEHVIYKCPDVKSVLVRPYLDADGYHYLIGYLILNNPIDIKDLKGMMSQFVPPFMIPEFFVELKAFPLTPNGKVDNAQLPVVMK